MTDHRKTIPAPAVDLYTRYIHGEISRRAFIIGVRRYAVAGLTATAIIDALMPNYALGQQVRRDDERIKASYETLPSPDGNGSIRGYLVRPFSADSRSAEPARASRRRRHPREPRPKPSHRGRGAPLRPGELHGLRARHPDLGRRLPRR